MDRTSGALDVFKALGDSSRLKIVGMLTRGESYVELIASRLGLTSATVSHHLKKLEEAGLVECHRTQFYMIYSLVPGALSATLAELVADAAPPVDDDAAYRDGVINTFMPFGKLTHLPSQNKKREVVLRRIISELEDKDAYTELEINEHIKKYYDDYCLIRREMISFGLLAREHESGAELYHKTDG